MRRLQCQAICTAGAYRGKRCPDPAIDILAGKYVCWVHKQVPNGPRYEKHAYRYSPMEFAK